VNPARDVWAYNGTQVEFFNGHWWTGVNVAKLLPPTSDLTGVIAPTPNNVYATGGISGSRGVEVVVLHDNGRTWSKGTEETGVYRASGQQFTPDGEGGLRMVARAGSPP
jgi:hypothetical protein